MSAAATGPRRRVAVAVVLRAGRVLVQARPPGRDYAGWWEFPGGKCEPGEDALACAARECREELGLEVRPLAVDEVVEWEYPSVRVAVHFVRCELPDAAREPVAREGQELLWAGRADLDRLRFLPANAAVLARLRPLLA